MSAPPGTISQPTHAEKLLLNDPVNGLWPNPAPNEQRVVRADVLRQILIDFSRSEMASGRRVVRVNGARIEGSLDLEDCSSTDGACLAGLVLHNCDIPADMKLSNSRLARLSLEDSRIGYVEAHGIRLDGTLNFRRVKPHPRAEGQRAIAWIDARSARIEGDVEGNDAHLVAPEPRAKENVPIGGARYALKLLNCNIAGHVYLIGLQADGGINVAEGDISGEFWLRGAHLAAGEGDCFRAQSSRFGSSVVLDEKFSATGVVWLMGARIAGGLQCTNAKFAIRAGAREVAIAAVWMKIEGQVWLEGAAATGVVTFAGSSILGSCMFAELNVNGGVELSNARIAGNLDCTNARLKNSFGAALDLSYSTIEGALFLRSYGDKKFVAMGHVEIEHLSVKGSMDSTGGVFVCHFRGANSRSTLTGSNAEVNGDFILNDARVRGGINLWGCRVGRDFKLKNARLESRGFTLSIPHWTIRGDLEVGAAIAGDVWCRNIQVDGNLDLTGLRMVPWKRAHPRAFRLDFENTQIGADLMTTGLVSEVRLEIKLKGARAKALKDSWPDGWGGEQAIAQHLVTLDLDGFQYEALKNFDGPQSRLKWLSAGRMPDADRRWLQWLRLQKKQRSFSPQPYRHLARVLRTQGHAEAAREIAIAENWNMRASWLYVPFKGMFGWFFGFGLSPSRAGWTALVCIVIGALGTWKARNDGAMFLTTTPVAIVNGAARAAEPGTTVATEEIKCGSEIVPAYYAVDLMLPVIPLHQETVCEIRSNYYWWKFAKFSYSVIGKIIATLALITFSGVLRVRAEELE